MADQWLGYVRNFDTLMEEALKVCVRNSLQNMFEAIHGDGTTAPSPILKLFANLKNNRVSQFLILCAIFGIQCVFRVRRSILSLL